jgi:hypothetical protein
VRLAEERLEMGSSEQQFAPTRTTSDSPFRAGATGRNVSDIKRDIEDLEEELNQEKRVAVVEQRVSVLVQGIFCKRVCRLLITECAAADSQVYRSGIVLMTGPFERLLGFIPKGVIAGLFW